ncbi:hypothetical protein HB779_10990 [Phyllobacterium sp. 628]|uniref:hypothetical protein n=1 Tax=Phyllobacterium sp. 628 TaxID=2718938 RepID=UPI001662585F|nr:hypothetical protein [Phyllobacterium sp. 628]QND52373.1 hypothetical protein HB779_10990 [Phyllobacterium sp. 628]
MISKIAKNIELSEAAIKSFAPFCSSANTGELPYVFWSLGGRKLGANDEVLETYPPGYMLGLIEENVVSSKTERVAVKDGMYLLFNPKKPLSPLKTYLIDLKDRLIDVSEV